MKKIIFIFAITLFGLFSCQNLSELNINPNGSEKTHPSLLLTQIEWDAFHSFNSTSPLYAHKMLVQTDGENSYQYYKWNRADFRFLKMTNVVKMIEEAEALNEMSYVAIGKFFLAYYYYNMTLMFGDIPYSKALKGEEGKLYFPQYDKQQDIIKAILLDLEKANSMLKELDGSINGDIIYAGNLEKWSRLINAYRLKILISMSKKENDQSLDLKKDFMQILTSENLMRDFSDNAQLVYLDQEGNRYSQFNSSSFGSGMYIDSTFIKRLQDHNDPRLFLFCSQTKEAKEAGKELDDFTAYEGGDPAAPYGEVNEKATIGKLSKVLERFHENPVNEPSILMSYAEQELIIAEASLRNWVSVDAEKHYENGVKASFKFYETYVKNLASFVDEDKAKDYLAMPINALSTKTSFDEKLELIITQKYFQSFFQGGWSAVFDNMRTSFPAYRRPQGVEVPSRWMYPQSEYDYNAANVSAAIQSQFGVGNDKIHEKTWWLK